ncbi:MAG: hypothetical protein HFG40_00625 [Bacilli bacterium]|nr:hypothetical protein [Bacilli bacterium]
MKFLSPTYLYNSIVNAIYIGHIQPLLIESFVEFYGEQARIQIEKLFDDLIILRREYTNFLKPNTREYMDYFRKVRSDTFSRISHTLPKGREFDPYRFSSQEVHQIVSRFPSLVMDDFITWKHAILMVIYYQVVSPLAKRNSNSTSLFVGTNLSCISEAKKLSDRIAEIFDSKNRDISVGGYVIPKIDCSSIVQLFGYGIPLHILIHEVNHLLHRKTILQMEDQLFNVVSFGISPKSPDFIYEIINDYMAEDIQKIFFRRMRESSQELYSYILSDQSIDINLYTYIDSICMDKIRNFYQLAPDLIKECLLQGEGQKLYKIIGSDVYDKINKKFSFVADCIRKNPDAKFSLHHSLEVDIASYETILNDRLDEYYQYEKTIGAYRTFPRDRCS